MTINDNGQNLVTLVEKSNVEDLFSFLQQFHRKPFSNINDVYQYRGVIDDQIDFIDTTATKYRITPLIIAAGKGSFEKVKILLVHGADPNKKCATGDTALNLAAHRQKYSIVELLLEYRANPNIANQAGKTALHRAVASYNDENAKQIRSLLLAGADTRIEDQNHRGPLDETVLYNRTEILHVLLSHDRSLVQRAYRAAIVAARLGHDKCLEILLNDGMDPNISDESNTSPLHVAVRAVKLTTIRLLITNGADPFKLNDREETPLSIAKNLPAREKEPVLQILNEAISIISSNELKRPRLEELIPLLRTRSNWTLEDEHFRSSTTINSSVENLLDPSTRSFWTAGQSTDAWVIFDLKREFHISGFQLIGSNDSSSPKDVELQISTTFHGPWLPVISFTCFPSDSNKNEFFFSTIETRFVRLSIFNNYGGKTIRIQNVAFYGIDSQLIELLREFQLEQSLKTLLSNGINDLESLDEHRDEILNSSDKFLHLDDHFRFLNLTSTLRIPQLTYLNWLEYPQNSALINEKFSTFSVSGNEGVTNRVKLEEQSENSSQIRIITIRDLEPIQTCSLVAFSDYSISEPGRYRIRVVCVDSPDIQTLWHEIVVKKSY